MLRSNRPIRALVAASAALAATAALASTATAATWSSSTDQIHGTGSVTISNGATSTACNLTLAGSIVGGEMLWPLNDALASGPCSQGTFALTSILYADHDGTTASAWTYPGYGHSPFGDYDPTLAAAVTNPAGGQPAKLVLDDTSLGYTHTNQELTATGTINLNNGNGGDISIQQ